MTSIWPHAVFLAVFVGTEAFFTWLEVVNVRHGRQAVAAERDWLVDDLGVDDPDDLLDYQRTGTGLSVLRRWVVVAAVLVVLYGGVLSEVTAALEATGLGTVASGTVFFVGAVVASRVVSLPFDAFDTFVVEEVFGFNHQSPRLWARDAAVSLAIGAVIVAALAAAVLAFVEWLPGLWWIAAWLLFVGFSVAMLVVYPRVIAPLFNDFEPVEAGDLRDAVADVFDRAGFECSQIYVMDASKRSSHSNAYFVGFGRTKRVVLFDTLIDQMDLREVQSVLAHELAHWKRAHVWKQIGVSAIHVGAVFAALAYLATADWLYAAFGLPADAIYAGLAVSGLWIAPVERWVSPLENWLSLRHEREADAFAVDVMGEGESMAGALASLASENLNNPFPHPLYATFHYTHPPIPERMRRVRELAGGSGDGDAGTDPDATAG